MRKSFLFCALIAGIVMMAGCKKEEMGGTTLKAVIDQDAKAFIGNIGDDYYPFWNSTDEVRINGTKYGFASTNNTYATINVGEMSAPYFAIYPNSIVNSMDLSAASASITLPYTQIYKKVDGHQVVNMPMIARIREGNILYFKNLCSVIRVNVKNSIPDSNTADHGAFDVHRIVVTVGDASTGVNICGTGTASITGTSSSATATLTMPTGTTNRTVALSGVGATAMETLITGADHNFDIAVPAFSSNTVTIKVETTTGKFKTFTVSNASLNSSSIVTLNANVTDLEGAGKAYLKPGPQFNDIIKNYDGTAPTIVFRYETPDPASSVNATRVDRERTGDIPIWAFVGTDPTTGASLLVISTTASYIYANPDCSYMFANLDSINSISSFDEHFVTDDVTDMSYMFAQNTSNDANFYTNNGNGIQNISGLESFNTANVTTMAHMFDGNKSVTGLDLSHFYTSSLLDMEGMFEDCTILTSINLSSANTISVTNMKDMFKNCIKMQFMYLNNFDMGSVTTENKANMFSNFSTARISAYDLCDIHCSTTAKTAMSNGTSLNTANVEFFNVVNP